MTDKGAFTLSPGHLTLDDLRTVWQGDQALQLDPGCAEAIDRSAETVATVLREGRTVYGVNTGFGVLAKTSIPNDQVSELQRRLVLSHSSGVGAPLSNAVVRLILLLKVNALARGFSGIRREVIDRLIALFNARAYPVIPAKGSVGASGDLAPLAHLSSALLGVGEISLDGRVMAASEALDALDIAPVDLDAKEGLALLNGTQVSTALALEGLFRTERLFDSALVAGAMSVDAALGSDTPFDPRIHELRGQPGQIEVAAQLRRLLAGSEIRGSHLECDRVQDPYSLRCQPQVMGAALDIIGQAAQTLTREANAVSDNPLVFSDSGEILSGGNFHAEPVAFAADMLALAIAEIGALSERRVALLTDAAMSSLPAFLVAEPGLNSGFMIAHVTAAALASENKGLAHPASVDSLPTSANQEDHVSMATHAARRLSDMVENSAHVVAIELLAAAQGLDLRQPLVSSPELKKHLQLIRKSVPFLDNDRQMGKDIVSIQILILSGDFCL
ncbi:histidine ammonia-lyase [Denitrobaculum tricleocarpae]|uniref:Histidine ammonia-lyase n=1 Tax=Denitrobaculum tricleocarpae TaxID=2591009 RepID=A0A545TKL2_9PROT|nr:histidine ammonia-lyase [Denitrobaculum tricleocarpae]TQV77726.1 histidine ammonia-lyase [Denitrobaculum tricleocarpae]